MTVGEEGEESEPDDDMEVEPPAEGGTAQQLRNLLENIRQQQNYCLARERFEETVELQVSQMSILEASSDGSGMTAELLRSIQNGYTRLYRRCRNRGDQLGMQSITEGMQKTCCYS